MREICTYSSEGSGNGPTGAGLSTEAKATEDAPDHTGTAPLPDPAIPLSSRRIRTHEAPRLREQVQNTESEPLDHEGKGQQADATDQGISLAPVERESDLVAHLALRGLSLGGRAPRGANRMGMARCLLALTGFALVVPLVGQEVDPAWEELEVLARGWTEDGRLSEYPPPLAARVDAAYELADELGTLVAVQVAIATAEEAREEAWDLLFDAALALANGQERTALEAATEELALLQAVENAARASGTWTLDDVAELSERRRVARSSVIAVAFAVRDRLRVTDP